MKSGANVNKMKPTTQRLSEVYCRPTTEKEWEVLRKVNMPDGIARMTFEQVIKFLDCDGDGLGGFVFDRKMVRSYFELGVRKSAPVSQFIDLIQDDICGWRLEEEGFKVSGDDRIISMNAHTSLFVTNYGVFIRATSASDEVEVWCNGVKTYTQLLTIIELIG